MHRLGSLSGSTASCPRLDSSPKGLPLPDEGSHAPQRLKRCNSRKDAQRSKRLTNLEIFRLWRCFCNSLASLGSRRRSRWFLLLSVRSSFLCSARCCLFHSLFSGSLLSLNFDVNAYTK